ncbi:unnamed protein product [Cylicocyclus nassatus]|uniref:C2H2-type domain-containing protein n=1 Tax=Cylicocyclus nassatus TaxID=53992 RepID=A0AA36MED0_CYLNA|nr:unnamed protein product [Cylicocyclus nassatus]
MPSPPFPRFLLVFFTKFQLLIVKPHKMVGEEVCIIGRNGADTELKDCKNSLIAENNLKYEEIGEVKPSTSSADESPNPSMTTRRTSARHRQRSDTSADAIRELRHSMYKCVEQGCNYRGPNARALSKHCKRMQHSRAQERRYSEECPVCGLMVYDQKCLIAHAVEVHQFKGQIEEMNFGSSEAFDVWRKDTEENTCTFYSRRGTTRIQKKVGYFYYKCHLTSDKRTRSKGLRSPRSKAANKSCTAFLNVRKDLQKKTIQVEYCTSHLGHQPQAKSVPVNSAVISENGNWSQCTFFIPRPTFSVEHTVRICKDREKMNEGSKNKKEESNGKSANSIVKVMPDENMTPSIVTMLDFSPRSNLVFSHVKSETQTMFPSECRELVCEIDRKLDSLARAAHKLERNGTEETCITLAQVLMKVDEALQCFPAHGYEESSERS